MAAFKTFPTIGSPCAEKEKLTREKLVQFQLVVLLHAQKCRTKPWACKKPFCSATKKTLDHMDVCQRKEGKICQDDLCFTLTEILDHWGYCNQMRCPVCQPFIHLKTNGEIQASKHQFEPIRVMAREMSDELEMWTMRNRLMESVDDKQRADLLEYLKQTPHGLGDYLEVYNENGITYPPKKSCENSKPTDKQKASYDRVDEIMQERRLKADVHFKAFQEWLHVQEAETKRNSCSRCKEETPLKNQFVCGSCPGGEMLCPCCLVIAHWGHQVKSVLDEKKEVIIAKMKREFEEKHSNISLEADNLNYDIGQLIEHEIKEQFKHLIKSIEKKADSVRMVEEIRGKVNGITEKMGKSFEEYAVDCQKFMNDLKEIRAEIEEISKKMKPMSDVNFAKNATPTVDHRVPHPRRDSPHSASGYDSD